MNSPRTRRTAQFNDSKSSNREAASFDEKKETTTATDEDRLAASIPVASSTSTSAEQSQGFIMTDKSSMAAGSAITESFSATPFSGPMDLAIPGQVYSSSDYFLGYSVRNPRNVVSGLVSGGKSLLKSVGYGVGAFVALPVLGAKSEGAAGFAKGLGLGIGSLITSPIVGAGVGLYQVARGVANTPLEISERVKGNKWDKKTRKWIDGHYFLDAEIDKILNARNPYIIEAAEPPPGTTTERDRTTPTEVKDTSYYDLLEVTPDASKGEIKKQFYKLALQHHPDKNIGNEASTEMFQKISVAHEVLSDDIRREEYDKYGKTNAPLGNSFDVGLFFKILFGSERLEPFTGKTTASLHVEFATKNIDMSIYQDALEFEKERNIVQMASHLRALVEPVIDASPEILETWNAEIEKIADELARCSFGDELMLAVGSTYKAYGHEFLASLDTLFGVGGKFMKLRASSRRTKQNLKIALSVGRSAVHAYKIYQSSSNRKGDKSSDDTNENKEDDKATEEAEEATKSTGASASQAHTVEAALPSFLRTYLDLAVLEVEAKVRKACKKIFKDECVDIMIRRKRAELVAYVGEVFEAAALRVACEQAEAGQSLHSKETVMTKLEEAIIKTMQRGDEAE